MISIFPVNGAAFDSLWLLKSGRQHIPLAERMLLKMLHFAGLQTGQMIMIEAIVFQRIIQQTTGDALHHHYLLAAATAIALYIDLVVVHLLSLLITNTTK